MTLMAKNLGTPDETMSFPNGGGDVVSLSSLTVGRGHLDPGWRWSNDVAPLTGTSSCQLEHVGYVERGTLHVEMDNGSALDLHAGDVFIISPGHDAWVVGDEPVGTLEWSGTAGRYISPATA